MLTIVPAQWDHIGPIARGMREADRAEVMASSGLNPEEALTYSLQWSTLSWTALCDDTPFIMWGVTPFLHVPNTGSPWLLGTPLIERFPSFFLRNSRPYVSQMLEAYPTHINYVDVRNRLSVRWLQWCGYKLVDFIPEYGVARTPFYQFSQFKG